MTKPRACIIVYSGQSTISWVWVQVKPQTSSAPLWCVITAICDAFFLTMHQLKCAVYLLATHSVTLNLFVNDGAQTQGSAA